MVEVKKVFVFSVTIFVKKVVFLKYSMDCASLNLQNLSGNIFRLLCVTHEGFSCFGFVHKSSLKSSI